MVTYMPMPRSKITLGATEFESTLNTAVITRLENGFDTATIELPDNNSALYPGTITNGTAVQIDVRTVGGSYTTIFKGVVRFPIFPEGNNEIIQLKCDGAGYGLGDTVVMNEYGTQSLNPTVDTINEALTDSTEGIITKYVNKILKSTDDSGFSYTTSLEAAGGGDVIPYIYFPYKPSNKAIDDLIDIITALRAGNAGLHWIVTTADVFLLKSLDQTLGGWTKYYGDSQVASTLTPSDFKSFPKIEPMGPEANYIIYNGIWRRPSNGDWAEGNAASWDDGSGGTFSDEGTIKTMGGYSVKSYNAAATGCGFKFTFPASIDLSSFSRTNVPSLNFDLAVDRVMTPLGGAGIYNNFFIRFFSTSGANYDYINPGNGAISKASTAGDQNFQHFNIQLTKYSKDQWQHSANSLDWADIESIEIWCPNVQSAYLDAFNIGGAQITRIAKNSTNITANKVKMKPLTNTTPYDDSLSASDDSGVLAQLAYSELLRLQKSSKTASIPTQMIKDALPGQWFHIHAKKKSDGSFTVDEDFRATKIVHVISPSGFWSSLELTTDLTNSHARPAYEDRNKVAAANRPEYQDRQATSIKAGQVDIYVTPLAKDYPS
jgi:hypothetical protein